jgi:hypothetical protein
MRAQCYGLVIVIFIYVNVSKSQESKDPSPVRDSRALAVLQQAVNAVGGLQQIDAMQSYVGTGHVTLSSTQDGDLVIKWRAPHDFRLDAHMSTGIDEWWTVKGWSGFIKSTDKKVHALQYQDVISIQAFCPARAELARALRDPMIGVSLLSPRTRDGKKDYGVRIRFATAPAGPGNIVSEMSTRDFYIDEQTFQIDSSEDQSYPKEKVGYGVGRRIVFSDYRAVGETTFPFTVSELIGLEQVGKERRLMEIRLDQVTINAPVSDQDFKP